MCSLQANADISRSFLGTALITPTIPMPSVAYMLLEAATSHCRDYTLICPLILSALVSSILPLGFLLLIGSGVFDEVVLLYAHLLRAIVFS